MSNIHVLKFGGTSLRDHLFILQAVEVVRSRMDSAQPVVVVSAIGGVTDQLVELTNVPDDKPALARQQIDGIRKIHFDVLHRVTGNTGKENNLYLEELFDELTRVCFDEKLKKEHTEKWNDHILSFGERASAHIFASALCYHKVKARALDAHHFIKTDAAFGEANVIPGLTRKLIADTLHALQEVAVITGFIGSTEQGEITTLGRSGSDYTAGLIAEALQAGHLEIWTDVDGVLTADPKIVPTACHIDYLSYEDISELAAHGAKVIHPKTIRPIRHTGTSVQVRNSYNPAHPGTLINRSFRSNGAFRSVTVTGPFTYFEIDAPDAHKLNRLIEKELERAADSEGYGYIRTSRYEPAQFLIRSALFERIEPLVHTWVEQEASGQPELKRNLYKVKKFTNRLNKSDLPAVNILNILNRKNIRPLRIHREYNQRYVSLLLPKEQAYTVARLINDYLIDGRTTVDLFIAGKGAVGGTLLNLIDDLNPDDVRLRVIGVCDSKSVNWNAGGIDIHNVDKLPEGQATDWPAIVQELTAPHRHNTIFVDATGSAEVARLYPSLLQAGIHIATPSKLANTFEQSFYDSIHAIARATHTRYRYETTVGAGLPVLSTISDLIDSGDEITGISGVLSGTMTYLFGELEKGVPFSEAVVKARDLGYAEPDPRDDLSGEDVARKFLTLARTIGLKIERSQLNVESLIPEKLKQVGQETFIHRLPEADDYWRDKINQANKKGKTLRYTGRLTGGTIEIGVQETDINSPLGQLRGTDNILRISTNRYRQSPIIIQGPGAGKEVTAAGLLSDILKISKEI